MSCLLTSIVLPALSLCTIQTYIRLSTHNLHALNRLLARKQLVPVFQLVHCIQLWPNLALKNVQALCAFAGALCMRKLSNSCQMSEHVAKSAKLTILRVPHS